MELMTELLQDHVAFKSQYKRIVGMICSQKNLDRGNLRDHYAV